MKHTKKTTKDKKKVILMLKLEKKRVHEQLFKECQSCIYGAFTSVCNIHKHAPSPTCQSPSSDSGQKKEGKKVRKKRSKVTGSLCKASVVRHLSLQPLLMVINVQP